MAENQTADPVVDGRSWSILCDPERVVGAIHDEFNEKKVRFAAQRQMVFTRSPMTTGQWPPRS